MRFFTRVKGKVLADYALIRRRWRHLPHRGGRLILILREYDKMPVLVCAIVTYSRQAPRIIESAAESQQNKTGTTHGSFPTKWGRLLRFKFFIPFVALWLPLCPLLHSSISIRCRRRVSGIGQPLATDRPGRPESQHGFGCIKFRTHIDCNSKFSLSQVLGFLGASPKEAPKQGLGQRPKAVPQGLRPFSP